MGTHSYALANTQLLQYVLKYVGLCRFLVHTFKPEGSLVGGTNGTEIIKGKVVREAWNYLTIRRESKSY